MISTTIVAAMSVCSVVTCSEAVSCWMVSKDLFLSGSCGFSAELVEVYKGLGYREI